MKGRQNPFVAREGLPFLLVTLIALGLTWQFAGSIAALPLAVLTAWLVLVFRDPHRSIPASPLGVVSPVDGRVESTGVSDCGVVDGEVHTIRIRVDSFGTYTARAPVEGKIMDLQCDLDKDGPAPEQRGLWLRTDENSDVLLQFSGYRFGLSPRAFRGFGERVGQGQRCAYLRLTRHAEIQLPLASRIEVEVGQRVRAGETLLGQLPH
ncbi:MAG: hypothetical protein U5K76_06820 [Woeseiaceae bacterium]|nr:hypothetical protein [Woeseiaceae bacterium]